MKKGIRTLAVEHYGDEKYQKLKEFGFDCVDFPLVDTETLYYTGSADEAEAMLLKERKKASQRRGNRDFSGSRSLALSSPG